MSFLSKINKGSFSNTEKEIIQYVCQHPEAVIHMTSKTLAEPTFTSSATIVRFCQKLGYQGFNAFKLAISQELESFQMHQSINHNFPVTQGDTLKEMTSKMVNLYTQTITESAALLHHRQMEKIVALLQQAEAIDLYGLLNSSFLASDFQFKCERIGKKAFVESYPGQQIYHAANADHTHVAIIISYSGVNKEMLRVAQLCQLNQTPIIVITGTAHQLLAKTATYTIEVPADEGIFPKLGSFSSKVSISFILDLLFSALYEKNYQQNFEAYLSISKKIGQIEPRMDSLITENDHPLF